MTFAAIWRGVFSAIWQGRLMRDGGSLPGPAALLRLYDRGEALAAAGLRGGSWACRPRLVAVVVVARSCSGSTSASRGRCGVLCSHQASILGRRALRNLSKLIGGTSAEFRHVPGKDRP